MLQNTELWSTKIGCDSAIVTHDESSWIIIIKLNDWKHANYNNITLDIRNETMYQWITSISTTSNYISYHYQSLEASGESLSIYMYNSIYQGPGTEIFDKHAAHYFWPPVSIT